MSMAQVQALFNANEDVWFQEDAVGLIERYLRQHLEPTLLPTRDVHSEPVTIPNYLMCLYWDAVLGRFPAHRPKAWQTEAVPVARLVDCGLMQLSQLNNSGISGVLTEKVALLALRRHFLMTWPTIEEDVVYEVRQGRVDIRAERSGEKGRVSFWHAESESFLDAGRRC